MHIKLIPGENLVSLLHGREWLDQDDDNHKYFVTCRLKPAQVIASTYSGDYEINLPHHVLQLIVRLDSYKDVDPAILLHGFHTEEDWLDLNDPVALRVGNTDSHGWVCTGNTNPKYHLMDETYDTIWGTEFNEDLTPDDYDVNSWLCNWSFNECEDYSNATNDYKTIICEATGATGAYLGYVGDYDTEVCGFTYVIDRKKGRHLGKCELTNRFFVTSDQYSLEKRGKVRFLSEGELERVLQYAAERREKS